MRRALLALAATLVVPVLLLVGKSGRVAVHSRALLPAAAPQVPGASPTPSQDVAPRATARPAQTARPARTTPGAGPPSTTRAPARAVPPSPSGAPTAPPRTTVTQIAYDGATYTTPYGPVQVRAVLTGSRITDVVALQLPSDTPRSQELSRYASPQLRQEALDRQSAQIDVVSGATWTSEGYAASLQSALDRRS